MFRQAVILFFCFSIQRSTDMLCILSFLRKHIGGSNISTGKKKQMTNLSAVLLGDIKETPLFGVLNILKRNFHLDNKIFCGWMLWYIFRYLSLYMKPLKCII